MDHQRDEGEHGLLEILAVVPIGSFAGKIAEKSKLMTGL